MGSRTRVGATTCLSGVLILKTDCFPPFGYEEVAVELSGGAQLASVSEGGQFSALTAEDRIELRGSYAGLMRGVSPGGFLVLAIASTPFSRVSQSEFSWWQLLEVDADGIWLAMDVMDRRGYVLGSLEVPVETGGHLPGLMSDQSSTSPACRKSNTERVGWSIRGGNVLI